jgi:hypothetical protein
MGKTLAPGTADMSPSATVDAWLTWTLSLVSLTGSICIILSYFIASRARSAAEDRKRRRRSNSNSKQLRKSLTLKLTQTQTSAGLIRNLALTDLLWFSSAFTLSNFWMWNPSGEVPSVLCALVSPVITYCRIASLMWTCAISYDVYQRVRERSNHKFGVIMNSSDICDDDDDDEEHTTCTYFLKLTKDFCRRNKYHLFVNMVTLPISIVLVSGNLNGFCEPGYESVGSWASIIFLLVTPIFIGIFTQLFVYFRVRRKMKLKAYPQSVRKRRQRVMYHYILVSSLCWLPTFLLYIVEASGVNMVSLDIAARATLYTSGFFNFLVYGMHDPLLIRAFRIALASCGLHCLLSQSAKPLKNMGNEKIVMFEEKSIRPTADISKDKRAMIRHHRLSKSDKQALYRTRPDLDPSVNVLTEPLLDEVRDLESAESKSNTNTNLNNSNSCSSSNDNNEVMRTSNDSSGESDSDSSDDGEDQDDGEEDVGENNILENRESSSY